MNERRTELLKELDIELGKAKIRLKDAELSAVQKQRYAVSLVHRVAEIEELIGQLLPKARIRVICSCSGNVMQPDCPIHGGTMK